jgi:hypothetical protein
MTKTQIFSPEWLLIKQETRAKLRQMFDLNEDISREVCNNQVICDGFSNQMLANITLEKVNEQLKEQYEDFMTAFNTLIAKLEYNEPIVIKSEALSKAIDEVVETKTGKKIDKRSKAYRDLKNNK